MREELVRIFGGVVEDVLAHASDMTENAPRTPAFVVEATRAEQIPELLKLASARGVPVTPKVTGLNIGGLAIPAEGGIVLDVRKLDRVLIDAANMVAWIEPGVSWQKLKDEAARATVTGPLPLLVKAVVKRAPFTLMRLRVRGSRIFALRALGLLKP